ncbi:MAG TPA: ARMT1-like domain-containing protein [Tepidisphaeraceae bacterium]
MSALEPFVRLKDASTYQACRWDMRVDGEARAYWVAFFKKHIETILALGVTAATRRGERESAALARAAACRTEFVATYDGFARDPAGAGRVTMLTLDEWRDSLLRKHGFGDAFVDLKSGENESVIALLPTVCRQLDALDGLEQFRVAIENVFAGNIFDMGAAGSAQLLLDGKLDFFATRKKLPARPWLVDDFDRFAARALGGGWRKVVFFVDNAGSDFLLGAVPLMRWLARRGSRVILAANERPTLNDMTVHDVRHWWPRVLAAEPSIAALPIEIVSTGTGEPLIDLAGVSPALNAAADDADLVILEGMGRGVESNLDAEFDCDAANLAMIKDEMIARRLNGKLYDVVCRFR